MRKILFRVGTILVLIVIAACMMVIGRGHTIYFDNKNLEAEGQKYETVRRINVNVNGDTVAKLSKKERGSATFMGQKFSFDIEVIREKDGPSEFYSFSIDVPYNLDGIVVNLPAMIEGASQSVWMSEFVPTPAVEDEDEEIIIDEFDVSSDG